MAGANGSFERGCLGEREYVFSKETRCSVCGDMASGYHYGAVACWACGTFFSKAVNKNIKYQCAGCNNCDISMETRNSCKACRFNKCLRMGMSKEYRSKTKSLMQSHKLALKDNSLLEAVLKSEPEAMVAATGDGDILESDREVLSTLRDLVDSDLFVTVQWATQIPGFTELCRSDQIRLFKMCWAEILSLDLAYRSMPLSGNLFFSNNFVLGKRQCKALHAEELFSQSLQVVERLDFLQISRDEYLILKALVLVNSDVWLEDRAAVRRMRELLLALLHDCVNAVRSNPLQHVSHLLLCLPLLRQVDASVRRFWTNVRREGKVPISKFFLEFLETYKQDKI